MITTGKFSTSVIFCQKQMKCNVIDTLWTQKRHEYINKKFFLTKFLFQNFSMESYPPTLITLLATAMNTRQCTLLTKVGPSLPARMETDSS